MVFAYHIIFAAYGFWLPNDPRGSWSDFVASWELLKFGKATRTNERRSLAHDPHDHAKRLEAKRALKHAPVMFSGHQAWSIAKGFAQAADEGRYAFLACSVLPDHVHAVLLRHERPVKQIVGHLKARGSQRLVADGRHPFEDGTGCNGKARHTPWVEGCWKVYLDSQSDIERAVEYVEQNPVKEGKPVQRWSFIKQPRK